jgi:YidC/Oxa1 family membrane protein insertase
VDNVTPADLRNGGKTFPAERMCWAGAVNKYFAVVLVPRVEDPIQDLVFECVTDSKAAKAMQDAGAAKGIPPSQKELVDKTMTNTMASIRTKPVVLPADPNMGKATFEFKIFAGPKSEKVLARYRDSLGIEGLLDYGWFSFIGTILLSIMHFFFSIVRNYGVAIVILTIIVKVALFPLTKKGQVSGYKMQRLQPKVKELQERFKGDKQKMNVEMLKLYKEHGVNPIGGCLPLLFQLPVFIGLYRALDLSIELRHAPFMFWMNDLSQPDVLCKLPFTILGATNFHLLPILMTITWFIQTLMQPKSPDPQMQMQQKIFAFMPLIFGILLYNMPSGLILYWFTSTLLGIGEQTLIKKYFLK